MPNRIYRQHASRFAVAVVTLVVATACSDANPPFAQGAVAPGQPVSANEWGGNWAGKSAEGSPVSFTIVGNEIRNFTIAVPLTGECDVATFETIVSAPDAVADQSLAFGDATNTVAVRGQFSDNPATVSGTVVLNYVGNVDGVECHSSGTAEWMATRNW
jgi:hypothetical protein